MQVLRGLKKNCCPSFIKSVVCLAEKPIFAFYRPAALMAPCCWAFCWGWLVALGWQTRQERAVQGRALSLCSASPCSGAQAELSCPQAAGRKASLYGSGLKLWGFLGRRAGSEQSLAPPAVCWAAPSRTTGKVLFSKAFRGILNQKLSALSAQISFSNLVEIFIIFSENEGKNIPVVAIITEMALLKPRLKVSHLKCFLRTKASVEELG